MFLYQVLLQQGQVCLAPDFSSGLRDSSNQNLSVKIKVEKALRTRLSSMCLVSRYPAPFLQQIHIFHDLSFHVELSIDTLSVAIQIPHQVQLLVSFGCPSPVSAHLDSVSIFTSGHLPLLPCLTHLSCLSYVRILSAIQDSCHLCKARRAPKEHCA